MRTVARDMAPSRDQGADRFRYSSDELRRARAALNFPAAIKPFYLNKSWSSLIIEEEESVPPPAGNQIVLGSTTTTFEWVDFLHEFLILPSNVYWQAAVVASIVINFFFTTYAFHFQKDLVIQVFHEMVITDILYLVDFSIALLYKYKPLLRFKLKVEKRNKFALLADAISLFPMELIYYSINGDESDIFVLYLLRMNSYIRFYRVIVFFGDLMNSVGQNQWALFFIKHILYFSILFHFFSCIWFTLGCTQDCDNVSTWTDQMEIEGDVTVWDWYINCAYFSLCTIANVGYGDLSATNQLEQFACIIAMLLGFGLTTGIFIGSLASQIVNRELRRAIFADLIYNIKKYLIDIQYEDEATKHVLAYYTILWTKKNGVKEAKNFDLLPLPLRIEICLDINYGLFHCSVLFQNLDESFLRSLSLRMKNEFYLPGDIIFYQNVAKYKMICILSGVIEILSDEDDESPMVSFTSGSCLGEIAMVLTCPSKATVRAATYTELQVLDKADFFRMMIDYPIAHQTIRSNIHDRIRLAFTRGTSIEKSAIVLTLLVSHSKVQSSIKKLKNHLHKRQGISQGEEDILEQVKKPQDDFNDSFLQLYNICENIQERDGDMCNLTSFPWIIQPNSLITTVWMHFIFSIVVMVCFIYPYYAGFERKFPTWLESLSEVADVIFIIDIYLSCTTGIEGKSGIIKRPKMILWKRMDSVGFYLDAFAVFPIEIYSLLIDDNRISVRYKSVLKLNRLLKVWQIPRYFRILEENLWVNLAFIRIMKYVLYLLLSSFWAGVALYMLACFIEPCSPGSWLTVLESVKNNRSPCTIYPCIMSVYFALVTLSRAGYGDIVPVNQQDMLLTMFNIIFGIMLFGFCIAEFTATITHKHRPRIMYQETIFAIITFMHDNNIDPLIVERVIKYFSLQWMYNQGINIRLKKKTILEDANWKLRQQVLAKERLATLNQVPLFQLADRDFLQLIISGSRVLLLPPNEIISYAGKISREMYIIQEGYCEVLNGKTGKHERKAGPGSHFGDIEMLVRVPSILTVRTITNCKVINISYPVYSQAVSMFPQIMKEINDILIDTDMNRSLRKCYHKPRSSFEDNVDVEHKPQKQHCLDLAYQYRKFKEFFARSYINVWRTCKDSSEDYWAPFKALKRFQFLKYCLFHCTISPTGGFIKVWCFLRVIAAFTVGMVYPFYWGVYPYAYSARWFITFLDVYAYIDIYLMLHVGYYNSMGLLIMHPLKTASHYIRNSFLTDILACFPFETLIPLFITVDPGELKSIARIREVRLIYCILTINRVLQIHRLVSAVQYLESNIFTRSKNIRILKFVPYTFVCINVWASLLVTLSCTYVDETMMDEATNSSMMCQPGSWFSDSPFQNIVNPMQLYLISFYSATTTVTGIGFGDLTAVSRASMIICMIMIILGTLLFGYMSASIVSNRACIHTTLSQYQEMLNEMRSFMEHENIDLHIQTRFISHFEYEWKRTHGVQPHVIFENFHTALMEDVVLWMYEQTLKAVPLFEQVDHSFYRVIGKHLKQMHFLRGETVIRSNDVQSNIYIIHHGKVEVLSSYHEMMACMGPGGLFGNIGSVNASVCTVNIVANKNLVVLTISSEILYSVLKNYPEVSRKMEVILKTVKDFIMPNTIIKDDESDSSYSRQEEDIGSAKIVMKLFQVSGSPVSSTTTGGTEATVGTVITTSTIATFGTIVSTQPPVNYLWPQNWFKFAILPESPVYTFQAYLVLIAAYLNCIVVSYQLAFQDHSISMLVMNGCLELIFYFKIFLELHQAYVDKFGEYVVDYKKIHDRYFKNRRKVAIDVIANIPLEIFAFFAPYGYRMKCASILQMSHLHRFAYIIEFYRARAHLLVVNKTFLKMSSLYIWVTLLIHCTACMWYFISCPLGYLIKDSWADKYKVPEKDPYTAYITSVYFIAGLFTGTGYGDLLPCSVGEVTVCIFMMIASKFCVALFIGDITTVLTSYTSTLTHYEYGIYQLRDALHNQKLSSHQMDKMWNYVRQLWKRESGMQMPRLVVRAPFVMRCDLMNAAYGHHLRNSYVFSNTNEDFLRQLTVLLHHYVFFPGNYIVQQGDTDMNIYFIHRGEVDVLTVHPNLTETIHDVLKPNDMFGVAQGLFHGIPHHFSFRAKTVVDIVSLHLDSWAHLLEYFPEAQAEIYKRASLIYINV